MRTRDYVYISIHDLPANFQLEVDRELGVLITALNFRFWLLPLMTMGVYTGVLISRWLSAIVFKSTTTY